MQIGLGTATGGTGVWIAVGIAAGVVLLLAVIATVCYNRIAKKKLRVDNAFSQLRIQIKRRTDLIPYLADVVKRYAQFESIPLAPAGDPASPAQLADAEATAGRTLAALGALAAQNPGLRTNAHFMQLQTELTAREKAIAVSRGFYNDAVMLYNRTVQAFPALLFAKLFRFKPAVFLNADLPSDSLIRGVPCPACGAVSNSETCPHCGTRIALL